MNYLGNIIHRLIPPRRTGRRHRQGRCRVRALRRLEQENLGTRDFEIFEAAPSEDAYGGVLAANYAATQLLEQLAEWVSKFMPGR